MQIQMIPLSQLKPSPRNVRRHDGGVDDLAASIKAHGLRQNLNVETPMGKSDVYEVVAGSRRLRALQLLRERGELPQELDKVPCMVLEQGDPDSGEVSLAENVLRVAMHPADEFVAYNELATRRDDPLTPDQIAARFGVPVLHVRQRMKLARISPKLVALYREGNATLEQLEALALTDDQALQEKVWNGARDWQRQPWCLRKALTEKEISADDPMARFVGVEAYKAAGGQVREDLFTGEEGDGLYFTDSKLLRQLAEQKLNKRADQLLRDGWSWAEARVDGFSWEARRKFTELEQKRGGDGKKAPWATEQKAVSGCIVVIGASGGSTETIYGLQRPEDKKKAAAVDRAAKKGDSAAAAAALAEPAKAKPKKANDELPMASVMRLQGFRTAVMREHLADNPRVAVAALAAALWTEGAANTPDGAVGITASNDYSHRPDRAVIDALEDREEKFEEKHAALTKRLKHGDGPLFAWLLKQPIELSLEILAVCSAEQLMLAQRSDQKNRADEGRAFAQLVGVDLSKHWQVTAEWLAEQPTGYILKVVTGVCGKRAAAELAKVKGKANVAAKACQQILDADPTWLPDPLLPPKPKAAKKAKV
ncbi:MAG: ParB/RepB/Spo0J family partition protein [Lysobacter sp.]|nr:ParB/RepB/Spo0J family partition protein [Lysobacter sp.]